MPARRYPLIQQYREKQKRLAERGAKENEEVLRPAFYECLSGYCQKHKLELIPELPLPGSRLKPDGTVRDQMRLNYGYWEAKDVKDDIDRAIDAKKQAGYPTDNILFDNGDTAVLWQKDHEVMRVKMSDDARLDSIIRAFLDFKPEPVANFNRAIEQFKADLPALLSTLRNMIMDARANNKKYRKAADSFLRLCREVVNPQITADDVREMLIQHILTRDIFHRVFYDEDFHQQNNIARQLEDLQNTFITREKRQELLARIRHYYAAIQSTASQITDHRSKQNFLRVLYENFYRAYNPKAADRLGVFYTPEEIVSFMVRATDGLTHKHFGRRLCDRHVQILDPATGTGTFVAELISSFPKANLRHKYDEELHANEVAILPYYIANLNIEHAYMAKTNEYREYLNACFVDTLDNVGYSKHRGQGRLGGLSAENIRRIKRQNEKEISVIIGNPPYNANQLNENENNKNRDYPYVDKRIKETYISESKAQKTKLYDMYARFIRWASDRIGENGVLAFVSNSSFIDARSFDGFRKVIGKEFNELWIIDLKGGSRDISGKELEKQGGNVFNVRVGIAVWFFVKNEKKQGTDINYYECAAGMSGRDKLDMLNQIKELGDMEFAHIVPDKNHNWINQTENNYDSLLCLADDEMGKRIKTPGDERTVYKLFSLGVVTNRDDWVYDFNKRRLIKKVKHLIKDYENARALFGGKDFNDEQLGTDIKWTRHLKNQLRKDAAIKYQSARIRPALYRPFTVKNLYYGKQLNEMVYRTPSIFPEGKPDENKVICFAVHCKYFRALATNQLPDLHLTGSSQCLPLYRYDAEGRRISNITKWGLQQFRKHYRNNKISAEDVFHYTYAVLHHPAYLQKYRLNILQVFPRLPFYANFAKWVKWGKRLMDLHINYAAAKPTTLRRIDTSTQPGNAKLKADKESGRIIIDEQTTLAEVPPAAWQYKLGKHSALEWVLDQHKEKTINDPIVRENFNTYRFADYKESAIDLLRRVCTVSTETIKIITEMEKEKR